MRTDGYVKTVVKSGASATEWGVNPLRMGLVEPYTNGGYMAIPSYAYDNYDSYRANYFFEGLDANVTLLYMTGSPNKKVAITGIEISLAADGRASDTTITINRVITSTEQVGDSSTHHAYTDVVPLDSSSVASGTRFKHYTTPVNQTENRTVFVGNFQSDEDSGSDFKTPNFLRVFTESGCPIILNNSYENLQFLQGIALNRTCPLSVNISWIEY